MGRSLVLYVLTFSVIAGFLCGLAASKEACFLQGCVVWSSWDVEELATGEIRRCREGDHNNLRL